MNELGLADCRSLSTAAHDWLKGLSILVSNPIRQDAADATAGVQA